MNALRALIVPLLLAMAWAHPAEPQDGGPRRSARDPAERQAGHGGSFSLVEAKDARQIVRLQRDGLDRIVTLLSQMRDLALYAPTLR